jgi:hypothetical protein
MPRKHITFPPPRYPEITKADDSLLRRISTTADSGDEATRYLAALRQIMQTQNGYLSSAHHQDYYPGDAIELCAERANDNAAAFTLCHLIIIQSARAQTCPFTLIATTGSTTGHNAHNYHPASRTNSTPPTNTRTNTA